VESVLEGIAVWIAFLGVGGFLYFNPLYTGSTIISYSLTLLCLFIGLVGLGIELNKLGDKGNSVGFDDLGLGLGFGLAWAFVYNFYPIGLANIGSLILFYFSIYGMTIGIIKILRNLFSTKKGFIVKLPIVIAQIAAFIATIATILDIFKVI